MIMNDISFRLKRHYLPLTLLALAAGFIYYLFRGNRNYVTFIAWASGYISLILLAGSLVIGTVYLILKNKNPVPGYFRRDLSVFGGILALVHSLTGLFVHLRGKTYLYFLSKTLNGYTIRVDNFGKANYSGLIAALIIILLLATSNDYLFKKLNPVRWKNIQRLSYLMFLLILIHAYYYWIGGKNMNLFYCFYIPLIIVVLTAQVAGILLRTIKFRDKG